MRLAIVATHPIQYQAPWFSLLARQLGGAVKVFYLWDFGVTEQVDVDGFQEVIRWDVPLLSGYEYEFVRNASRQPGTHHFWGLRNPSLLAQVKDFRPDAVLLFAYNFASTLDFIFRWDRAAAPLIFRGDSHRLVADSGLKGAVRRKVITAVFRRFAACLYVGQANRDYFSLHGVPKERLFFVPHAVDNKRFRHSIASTQADAQRWRAELGIPERSRVILFAGKFGEKKRPADLLNAFLQVARPGEILLFVGSGPLESELRSLAGSNPAIRFAPFQNQSLMPRTYAAGDLFVLPSAGSGETWGLAVNEAMCMGSPIIASSHVGCVADLVKSYVNGLVFPAGNVGALGEALREALSDIDRLKRWGTESQRIVSGYSFDAMTIGLEQALASVCPQIGQDWARQI